MKSTILTWAKVALSLHERSLESCGCGCIWEHWWATGGWVNDLASIGLEHIALVSHLHWACAHEVGRSIIEHRWSEDLSTNVGPVLQVFIDLSLQILAHFKWVWVGPSEAHLSGLAKSTHCLELLVLLTEAVIVVRWEEGVVSALCSSQHLPWWLHHCLSSDQWCSLSLGFCSWIQVLSPGAACLSVWLIHRSCLRDWSSRQTLTPPSLDSKPFLLRLLSRLVILITRLWELCGQVSLQQDATIDLLCCNR